MCLITAILGLIMMALSVDNFATKNQFTFTCILNLIFTYLCIETSLITADLNKGIGNEIRKVYICIC